MRIIFPHLPQQMTSPEGASSTAAALESEVEISHRESNCCCSLEAHQRPSLATEATRSTKDVEAKPDPSTFVLMDGQLTVPGSNVLSLWKSPMPPVDEPNPC